MLFTVIPRIILIHQTQRNLGELKLTHKSITNYSTLVLLYLLSSGNSYYLQA